MVQELEHADNVDVVRQVQLHHASVVSGLLALVLFSLAVLVDFNADEVLNLGLREDGLVLERVPALFLIVHHTLSQLQVVRETSLVT